MPHVNVWIRKEDYDKWLSIDDKPRWLHDALSGTGKDYTKAVVERKKIEKIILGKPIDYSKDELCPHGYAWLGCPKKECQIKARNKGL